MIETVGKTAPVVTRKDLNMTRIEELAAEGRQSGRLVDRQHLHRHHCAGEPG